MSLENVEKFLNKHYWLKERKKALKEKRLFSVEIELTNLCQLACSFCYNSSKLKLKEKRLTYEKAKKLLDELVSLGIGSISWLGGEPLLNKDTFKILNYAHKVGIKENTFFTNGLALSPNNCKKIKKHADLVVFHLDTINPEEFASIQDVKPKISKKWFKTILKGLDNLIASGFSSRKIRLNLTLMKPIVPSVKKTMDFAIKKKKFQLIQLLPILPIGRGKTKDWLLDKEILKKIYEYRSKIEKRPEWLVLGTSDWGKHYCLTNCYITSIGDVQPCCGVPKVYGNIYEESLKRILKRNYKELSFGDCIKKDGTNNVKGKCNSCVNSEYCFGCRAKALAYGKSINDSDPVCWIK